LELLKQNLFQFAPLIGRLNYPKHSLSLIVKGTFNLKPGQTVMAAEEQLFPTGDEFYPDDEEMLGSPRYESDFAYLKPKTDLLLVGKSCAPNGTPIPACKVAFQVGGYSKTIGVFGNRFWKRNAVGMQSITEPGLFTEMELRYENSYGGKGFKKNPAGKGFWKGKDQTDQKLQPLPNIEDPNNLVNSPHSKVDPAGFGPLNRMWQYRHAKMGTYKGNYLKERWPWFPMDFDWSHFNAAPPDMKVEGFLRGDETLYFENLHPKHSQYTSKLPGLRVRCFVKKLVTPESEETTFLEIPMNLDTLWVDMEAEKLVLVWRGWTAVLSEEYEEVQNVFIMSEPLDQEPQSLDQCHKLFLIAQAEAEEEWEMAPEEPEPPEEIKEPEMEFPEEEITTEPEIDAAAAAAVAKKEKQELIKKIETQTAAIMSQLGIDMDSLPPEVQQQAKEQQEKMMNKLTEEDPAKVMAMEQEEQEAKLKEELDKLGVDYDNLPPLSDKAKAEQDRYMQEMGVTDPEAIKDENFSKMWQVMAAVMPSMGMDPENLTPLMDAAKEQMAKIKKQLGLEEEDSEETSEKTEAENIEEEAVEKTGKEEEKPAKDKEEQDGEAEAEEKTESGEEDSKTTEEEGAPSTKESLKERAARGESIAGADLSGQDLSGIEMKGLDCSGVIIAGAVLTGMNFEGAILANADLKGTDLSGANLSGANLVSADLSGAKLEKANLQDADVTESILNESNLTGATLNDAVFEKAKMTNACLDQAQAENAVFSESDLSDASFKNAELTGADFSNSKLHNADFQNANLSEATLEGAAGTKANFKEAILEKLRASEGCDFSQGCFIKASGQESIWHNANLTEADFTYAQMEGTDFTKATLENATLSATNMKFSRFNKANLKQAKMVLMNLFQGSLEKADLTNADLRGSNMYGAEFLDALIDGTLFTDTNLKMTKLEKK